MFIDENIIFVDFFCFSLLLKSVEKLPVHLNFSLIQGVTLLYILPLFQFSGNSMHKNSIYITYLIYNHVWNKWHY